MKNREKFVNEIIEIALNDDILAVDKDTGIAVNCCSIDCSDCLFFGNCNRDAKDAWAESEYKDYKEPIDTTPEDTTLRWVKTGEFVPTYRCPKCGKTALKDVVFVDDFRDVQSSFCPFCGVRLRNAK